MGQEKKKEEPTLRTKTLHHNGTLYETINHKGAQTFLFLDGNQPRHTKEVKANGLTYKPQIGQEVEKGVVRLCTGVENYTTTSDLLQEIITFIHTYADIPPEFEKTVAYYILTSWVYDKLDQINYLSFMGDWGTGKSRCKLTIGILCYCPILINGGASSAAIYRICDKWNGTILIDEADFGNTDESADVIKLLNCGNEKGSAVAKCDKNDPNKIDFFDAYCPKIIARRFEFSDKALESRCLTHITQESTRDDLPIVIPPRFWKESEALRNKLMLWRLRNYSKIENVDHNIFEGMDIIMRLQQANTSIGTVLYNFEEEFKDFQGFLMEQNKRLMKDRSESREGICIQAYIELKESKMVITSSAIADKMNDIAEHGDNDRYSFTARGISKLLKALGFERKSSRDGLKVIKVLELAVDRLKVLRKRYCVNLGGSEDEQGSRHAEELEWFKNNDFLGNREKAEQEFGKAKVDYLLSVGELLQKRPDWLQVMR